jgi:aminoglycoside phosphotransferase
MKIRIKGNSIRYRLTKTEVETFCKEGSYKETTDFGNSRFTYVLKAKKDATSLAASFENNTITLYLPDEERTTWATSDRVGYQSVVDLTSGKQLFLLVEKDFVCLDETVEDQSDNYPNPLADKNPK